MTFLHTSVFNNFFANARPKLPVPPVIKISIYLQTILMDQDDVSPKISWILNNLYVIL